MLSVFPSPGTGCTVTVISGHGVPIHSQPGVTGLSPEPEGDEGEAAAPFRSGDDQVDRVVLVTPGETIRIESSPSA